MSSRANGHLSVTCPHCGKVNDLHLAAALPQDIISCPDCKLPIGRQRELSLKKPVPVMPMAG